MPNKKERHKKAGRNKSKKTKAMRRSVSARKRSAGPPKRSTDHPDEIMFKPVAADDKYTRQGAR
jgi:hypothetical protein